MATDENPSKSNGSFLQVAMAMLAISVVGLAAGYGISSAFVSPHKTTDSAGKKLPAGLANAAHGPAESAQNGASPTAPTKNSTEDPASIAGDAELQQEPALGDMQVVLFPPIITNIAMPQTVWIRLEGHILVRKDSKTNQELLATSSAEQILAYVRTLKLSDIQGTNGLYYLTEDINEIIRNFSGGDVRSILISGFVVE
jgi:flagellar FliL protein